MRALFQTVRDVEAGAEILRDRHYGVIHAADRRFLQVCLRPFPKLVLLPEVVFGRWRHRVRVGDWCQVFYNQPWRHRKYLAVTYMVSARNTTFATIRRCLEVLDEIARLKGTDALLCDAMNWRISAEIFARFGWEPHCPSRWHRHYIRRFYGAYPPRQGWMVVARPAN